MVSNQVLFITRQGLPGYVRMGGLFKTCHFPHLLSCTSKPELKQSSEVV